MIGPVLNEVVILVARKGEAANVLEALPYAVYEGEGDPCQLDIRLTASYGWHWTGKTILKFLYKPKMLELPLYHALCDLYSEGKIDRVDYRWQTYDSATKGRFSLHGNWLRTLI